MKMNVQLDKELSTKVKQLANEMGLGEDEVIAKIVEWYFEDSEK